MQLDSLDTTAPARAGRREWIGLAIAKQLGHRDTTVTRRVYAGVWRRIEREVSAKMDAQLAMVI